MATIDIQTAEGKKASTAELADSVFGIEPNIPVMHQVVRVDEDQNLILLKGAVPGGKNATVRIRQA